MRRCPCKALAWLVVSVFLAAPAAQADPVAPTTADCAMVSMAVAQVGRKQAERLARQLGPGMGMTPEDLGRWRACLPRHHWIRRG